MPHWKFGRIDQTRLPRPWPHAQRARPPSNECFRLPPKARRMISCPGRGSVSRDGGFGRADRCPVRSGEATAGPESEGHRSPEWPSSAGGSLRGSPGALRQDASPLDCSVAMRAAAASRRRPPVGWCRARGANGTRQKLIWIRSVPTADNGPAERNSRPGRRHAATRATSLEHQLT